MHEPNRSTGMPSRPSDDFVQMSHAIGQRSADPQHLRGLVDRQQRRVAIKSSQHLDAADTATYDDVIRPINPSRHRLLVDTPDERQQETTADNHGSLRVTDRHEHCDEDHRVTGERNAVGNSPTSATAKSVSSLPTRCASQASTGHQPAQYPREE